MELGRMFRSASYTWRSLLDGYRMLKKGLTWELGDVGVIRFWLEDGNLNCEETNIVSIVDVDEINCDVLSPLSCKDVVSMLLKSVEEVMIGISNRDSLVRIVISSEEDAFKLYNDHAFRMGFRVRKGNQKFRLFLNGGVMQIWKIFDVTKVTSILDKYILKRWKKDIYLSGGSTGVGDARKSSKNDIVGSSVWRRRMLRKFSDLISASELNMNAQECIEEGSVGRRAKGVHNVRKKSIVEIKCNQVRGKRKSTLMRASRIKAVVQLSPMKGKDLNAPSSECQLNLGIYNSSNAETSSDSETFTNFMQIL
ncbi:hypothetical protein M9H77_35239 [Catharanthus roseus]|uniref:Uncharacterized protein n=1 Tax=Catharanthus roseus TaxID=4058 RepID=A0ACB9ZNG2_CATRO|nr:hypothetical protein M9H77_35239 [Catharanthus roseus]